MYEHEDPETTLGVEFFAITMNGFWFFGVVVKSFVLNVAVFSNPSVNSSVLGLISAKESVFDRLKF